MIGHLGPDSSLARNQLKRPSSSHHYGESDQTIRLSEVDLICDLILVLVEMIAVFYFDNRKYLNTNPPSSWCKSPSSPPWGKY